MKAAKRYQVALGGKRVEYRLVRSKSARKLRVRVGISGVEVVKPEARQAEEVSKFLHANEEWIVGQLERIENYRGVRRPERQYANEILYRGKQTPVHVEYVAQRRSRTNQVTYYQDRIVITTGSESRITPAKSLENWLRKQARGEIERQLHTVTRRLKRHPRKVYVMGQRTKWGNCSPLHNLSFNWRLIMAPDFVLQYLVIHEAVHLAIPDHSPKFWLTVQSICPQSERARQWLCAYGRQLLCDLRLTLYDAQE